jgi:hexosaminidase
VVDTCTSTVSGTHHGPLTVTAGVTCLAGATVSGPVVVRPGGSLIATDASVHGSVSATGAASVEFLGGTVDGPVGLVGTTSTVTVEGVRVNGPLVLTGTNAGSVLAGNTVDGPMFCTGNTPAPVNNGRPNTVRGPSTGQCGVL